ncbi:hypothetical protein JCM21900_003119 [Sporobolomyces salmonicolor]
MPPVFGGAPKCPTCGKSVYFAEQVLGPGGVAYHKLCLKCVACGKILEPRLLVDHDGEAYCKACHGKSFGTKGYGAGGALVGEYVSRASASPTRPTATGSAPASPARAPSFSAASPSRAPALPSRTPQALASPPPRPAFSSPAAAGTFSPPRARPVPQRPSSPPAPPFALSPFSASRTALAEEDEKEEDEGFPPSAAPPLRRPLPVPPSAPAAVPAAFALRSISSSTDLCRRCGTQVYFAEQAMAVGSKWHKRCLRCASCSTTLNSHLAEKDGLPYCRKCYQQQWGTGSLGVMSRPSLY